MDNQEVTAFLDTIAYGEAQIRWRDNVYFFNGPRKYVGSSYFDFDVYRLSQQDGGIDEIVFECHTIRHDTCLFRFLEAKIWDGRTFWEAAPEMEWI